MLVPEALNDLIDEPEEEEHVLTNDLHEEMEIVNVHLENVPIVARSMNNEHVHIRPSPWLIGLAGMRQKGPLLA